MPGTGIPLGPPLAFGEVTFVLTLIALGMLAVLGGILMLLRARNGHRSNRHSDHRTDDHRTDRRGRRLAT